MKTTKLVVTLILFALSGYAQTQDDYIEIVRGVLKTEKKAAIAEVMTLSEQEAEVFWPLYNEYEAKDYEIQSKRVRIIKDLVANFENLSDEEADNLWISYTKYKQEILNLNKVYYKKFKKILPAAKAARFFQALNKIAAAADYHVATQIPIIEIK